LRSTSYTVDFEVYLDCKGRRALVNRVSCGLYEVVTVVDSMYSFVMLLLFPAAFRS